MRKSLPDFSFEKKLWGKGYQIVAGIDEVGRGALAGPVVTGCVIFKLNSHLDKNYDPENLKKLSKIEINDSKKLSSKQREKADIWIKTNSVKFGVGKASVAEINRYGIVKATNIAFRRAIKSTGVKIDYLLIDAFYVPFIKGIKRKNQRPIVKGDEASLTIAAASIIAKVYRDDLMTKLSLIPKYKNYFWNKNKGYGTLEHRNAIKSFGKTRLHRVSFLLKLS